MLDQSSKDATQDSNKHFLIWWMLVSSTLQASVFMWKNYSEHLHFIKNTGKDLTMNRMFDISEKLVARQSDEICGVNTISWCDSSWKHLSLIGGEEVIRSLAREGLRIFRFCVMPWTDEREPTIKYCLGRQVDVVQKFITTQSFGHNCEPMEFEWNIFPGKSQNNSQDELSSCRRSMTSYGDLKKMSESSANLVSISAKRFSPGRWSFLGPGSEKKWYPTHESKPRGDRTESQSWWLFRATSPLSRGTLKKQRWWKLPIHFCADEGTIETVFRTIISVNQLSQCLRSILRFVWRIEILPCKNRETCFGRTIWPEVRAEKFVDENTYTFDRSSCARRSIAKVPRTSGKAITTKSCD